jgi:hypothetical protein
MSRSKPSLRLKHTGTGSNDLDSGKVDGFQNGEGDMSKKKRQVTLQPGERIELDSSVKIEPVEAVAVIETPIPREDEARPCTLCESRRPIGKSYSRVYCTKAKVRYCRCSYCGHTWTQERK